MKTRSPNFFIVGGPNCGTTALFEYLKSHPQVFLPSFKEPHHFAMDFPPARKFVRSRDAYLQLFDGAKPHQIAVGEASVLYMYSRVAIPEIHRFDPNVRLIAMVRNPIDMVYSYYAVNRFHFDEDQPSFADAWRLQEARRQGRCIPETCIDASVLMYGDIGRLGAQVERMLKVFPREQVEIIVFDDFVRDTRGTYRRVLAFLGLGDDGRSEFPRINENKDHRFPALARVLMRPPRWVAPVVEGMKRAAGSRRQQIARVVLGTIMKTGPRAHLPEELRSELRAYFREDVDLLSTILQRDLTFWVTA